MKYLGKCLPSLLSRLSFSPMPLFPFPCLNHSYFHHTLHSVPANSFDEETVSVEGWEQYIDFFLLLLLASYCSPAPACVASGPQSLQRCPCPSTGNTKNEIPLVWHTALLSGVHLFVCSQKFLFPLISLILSPLSPNTPLHILSHVSHFECPPVCPLSFLDFLPPAAAILPQTCLKRNYMWSSVWLTFCSIMDYFPPSRAVWNPLWPGHRNSVSSCTPSTKDTLQPLLPNPVFHAWCIRASLPTPWSWWDRHWLVRIVPCQLCGESLCLILSQTLGSHWSLLSYETNKINGFYATTM